MIITGPGFYTSKAGKCEVVAVKGDYAFGLANGGTPACWCLTGGTIWAWDERFSQHITGPWVEPRKPLEGYVHRCWASEENPHPRAVDKNGNPQWVRVREVEDSNQ